MKKIHYLLPLVLLVITSMTLKATGEDAGQTWKVVTLQDNNKTITLKLGDRLVLKYDCTAEVNSARVDCTMSQKDILEKDPNEDMKGGFVSATATVILDIFKPIKPGQVILETKLANFSKSYYSWGWPFGWQVPTEDVKFVINIVE